MKTLAFIEEVKKETSKITWVNKKDLIVSTISVFLIVGVFSVFFLLSDLLISKMITYLLGAAK